VLAVNPSSSNCTRSVFQLLLLGSATAFVAGCATGEPSSVAWQRQSVHDQHVFMPGLVWDTQPTVIVQQGAAGPTVSTGPQPQATQAVVQGDRILLMSQESYARWQSNPQALGASAAPAGPVVAPAPAK
jgi:hypothetical protein